MTATKRIRRQRHQRSRVKKLAKQRIIRKKFEKLKHEFPVKAMRHPKVRKVGTSYRIVSRPIYTQFLPISKKFKPVTKRQLAARKARNGQLDKGNG